MKTRLFLLFLCAAVNTSGNVRLPVIWSDNMVLQRDKPVKIWGWADAGEKIGIQFKKQQVYTRADASGRWHVLLKPEPAGGPFQIVVKGRNTIVLNNILVGEVWICSGQSNMEWPVSRSMNASEEIYEANYPEIRHFKIPKAVSSVPDEDISEGEWTVCSQKTVGDFTAVGYFFARELYHTLQVPIGLINTSWGGTHSETWTSRQAFEQCDEFNYLLPSIPSTGTDELVKIKNDALLKKLAAAGITLPSGKETEHWMEPVYDDETWPLMTLPGLWEVQSLDGLDGVVWFRKNVILPEIASGKEAILSLCKIDDSDITYLNGVRIGGLTNKYNEPRIYNIPPGVLKEGINVIALRVEDTGGGGGIYGDVADLTLTFGSTTLSLAGPWKFNIESLPAGSASISPNSYPCLLFNAMIHPLLNLNIRGAIWYQGESNAGRAWQYRTAFPLLIKDWRNHWQQGDFPFYFVQLASYMANNGNSNTGSTWAELREAQSVALSLPNTGMAVTIDIGDADDIHPANKQGAGKRLALVALNKTYGLDIVCSGPKYNAMNIEGNRIRISFTETAKGLLVKDKYGYVRGFEIAGSDRKFVYAMAQIEGSSVVVYNDTVMKPVAVRYAWADNPEDANLFNSEGLPAAPFRTDTWEGITANAKFTVD